MSDRIRSLRVAPFRLSLAPPAKLASVSKQLSRRYGAASDYSATDAREAAAAFLRLRPIPDTMTSLQRRGLVSLVVTGNAVEALRLRALEILDERQHLLALSDLLVLWQAGGELTARFWKTFAVKTLAQISRRPRRLPVWIQELAAEGFQTSGWRPRGRGRAAKQDGQKRGANRNALIAQLMSDPALLCAGAADVTQDPTLLSTAILPFATPAPRLQSWIVRSAMPPHKLRDGAEGLGITITLGVGLEAVLQAIQAGPDDWWALSSMPEILDWADGATLEIQKRVAERLLLQYAARFGKLRDIREELRRPGSHLVLLRRWVIACLRRPDEVNGQWLGVDERARTFMERMLVLDVFEKILSEFRRHDDTDRADFWLDYVNELRDAAFLMAGEVAVCLMAFDGIIAVEFGTTGNAAYLYGSPKDRPRLALLPRRTDMTPADFKSRGALRLWRHSGALTFLDRIIHSGNWQYNARSQLARLGVHI